MGYYYTVEGIIGSKTVNIGHNTRFTRHKPIWWDVNSELRALHQADILAVEYMKEILEQRNLVKETEGFQLRENLRILDVGCGGGILSEQFARAGANVFGIDINKGVIEAAQEHAKLDPYLKNLEYRWESIEEHSLNNAEEYDIVILNYVLQHAKNHEILLQDCIKTLKPHGIFFVSSFSKTYVAWLKIIVVGEILLRYFVRGGFDWNDFINVSDVETILRKHGCNPFDVKGIYYDAFSSGFKWSCSTDEVYIMHAVKSG